LKSLKPLYSLAFKDFAAKPLKCLLGEAFKDFQAYYPTTLFYFKKKLPLQGVAHQCGTCRFGEDPETSVLNLNCQTHDVNNLYVVDSSFFCSSAAVNPTLTIIANALRVGDHLAQRLA
jgi:choline dehydrogenase-like flavoprotein